MSKCKIKITHSSEISESMAVRLVGKVIDMGRVSDFGKKYCFNTVFDTAHGDVHVIADRTYGGTDTFRLRMCKEDEPT